MSECWEFCDDLSHVYDAGVYDGIYDGWTWQLTLNVNCDNVIM